MTVHHFPARPDLLERALVRASVWCSEWRAVLAGLEAMFPASAARLDAAELGPDPPPRLAVSGRTLAAVAPGTVVRLAELDPAETPLSGALPPRGEAHGAALLVHREGRRVWTLSVALAGPAAACLEAGLLATLRRFAPAVQDSFLASFGLRSAAAPDETAVRAAWDRAPFGVALITTALRPLVTNVIADDLLAVRALFAPAGRSGRLRPASRLADERLERAVERVIANPLTRASLDIGEGGARERLTIRIEALDRSDGVLHPRLAGEGARPGERLIATLHSPGRMAAPLDVSGEGATRRHRAGTGRWPSDAAEPDPARASAAALVGALA